MKYSSPGSIWIKYSKPVNFLLGILFAHLWFPVSVNSYLNEKNLHTFSKKTAIGNYPRLILLLQGDISHVTVRNEVMMFGSTYLTCTSQLASTRRKKKQYKKKVTKKTLIRFAQWKSPHREFWPVPMLIMAFA